MVDGLKIQGMAMVTESPTLTKLLKSPSRLITDTSWKVLTRVAVASEVGIKNRASGESDGAGDRHCVRVLNDESDHEEAGGNYCER